MFPVTVHTKSLLFYARTQTLERSEHNFCFLFKELGDCQLFALKF